jgi:hypothetical protein
MGGSDTNRHGLMTMLMKMRSLNVFFIFLLLFIVFSLFSPGRYFASKDNLVIFLSTTAEFGVIAIAVGMLMIAGEFDLSVGSILVFTSYCFVSFIDGGLPVALALFLTLLIGAGIGCMNGIITVKAGIPSFITTLGGMLLWRGITLMWSGGQQKGLDLLELPVANGIINGVIGGILPTQFLWFIGITLFLALLMHFHRFGNWVFTTGDNRQAARAMGIGVDLRGDRAALSDDHLLRAGRRRMGVEGDRGRRGGGNGSDRRDRDHDGGVLGRSGDLDHRERTGPPAGAVLLDLHHIRYRHHLHGDHQPLYRAEETADGRGAGRCEDRGNG